MHGYRVRQAWLPLLRPAALLVKLPIFTVPALGRADETCAAWREKNIRHDGLTGRYLTLAEEKETS